eukprot:14525052-Heterocapsa_arctica.AAC.1
MVGYMDKIKNDYIAQCSENVHFQSMEAYSDHSKIPELYQHKVRPSIKPGRKRSGKAHNLLVIVMIGYIGKITNECISNKEMCGMKKCSEI